MSTVTGKDSHQDSKDSFRQGCWEANSSAVHLPDTHLCWRYIGTGL